MKSCNEILLFPLSYFDLRRGPKNGLNARSPLKHLSQVVVKKKMFEYISMYFPGLNLRPLARGRLGHWDLRLNKLGKGPPGHATYQIQES